MRLRGKNDTFRQQEVRATRWSRLQGVKVKAFKKEARNGVNGDIRKERLNFNFKSVDIKTKDSRGIEVALYRLSPTGM